MSWLAVLCIFHVGLASGCQICYNEGENNNCRTDEIGL